MGHGARGTNPKETNPPNSFWWKWIFLLVLLSTFYFSLKAQSPSATASLVGKVVDSKTNEEQPFATVIVIGTYIGAQADLNGNYEIKNLKPGNYSIKFSAIGYSDKIYNNLNFGSGERKELKVTLTPVSLSLGEVEVVGEKNPINLESGKSEVKVQGDDIRNSNLRDVKEIVAMQNGVTQTPNGLSIRGGRVYETSNFVEGLNATDPLAGNGFGAVVGSTALKDVTVNTSGSDANMSGGNSGTINSRIRDGGDKYAFMGSWNRDNLNFTGSRSSKNQGTSFNTDFVNLVFSGPVPFLKNRLKFFVSGDMGISDLYFRDYAGQLNSSLMDNPTAWCPRYSNSYSGTAKLTFQAARGFKISLFNMENLNINQDKNSLQVVGFNAIMQPGFQYPFSLNLDNATTYTSKSNLTGLNVFKTLGKKFTLDLTIGRLFTNMRADANGRQFRSATVDQVYDPASIVTNPITVFNPNDPTQVYVNPGPGLYNNNGITTLWHDHWVQEYTVKATLNYISTNKVHLFSAGFQHKEQQYQWIDVTSPWIGAPVKINDTLTLPSTSVGSTSALWQVKPAEGFVFAQDEIRYKGIIANLGLQFAYWAPGKYIDDAVNNPNAPITDAARTQYHQQTDDIFGRRYKARLLPKMRISFPISDNHVMYVSYTHSMQLPNANYVYNNLDPKYEDQSVGSSVGNPNVNPTTSVSYEVGLKSKIGANTSAQLTAFYKDMFDYIVAGTVEIKDQTGRYVDKTFYYNQDYARIRGIELSIFQRIEKTLYITFGGAYQLATGKSNSSLQSAQQIQVQGYTTNAKETFLAWDTPFNLKFSATYTPDTNTRLFGFIPLKGIKFYWGSTFSTGLRYTPYQQTSVSPLGRPIYEPITDQPYAKIGTPIFNTDIRISKDLKMYKSLNLTLSVEIKNLFNNLNAQVIDPVTGRAYQTGDPLPSTQRDPTYQDPQDNGLPPNDPSRYRAPRQIIFGLALRF